MRWARGLNKWTGQISIMGTTADPAIPAEERRKLRPKLPRASSHSASIFVARNAEAFAQAEHLVRSAYASLGYDTEFLALQNTHQRDAPLPTDPAR